MGVRMLLSATKRMLLSGYMDFQAGKVDKTVSMLEAIHKNVVYMATAADY